MATIEEQFKANTAQNTAEINNMYDNSLKKNKQTLQGAYNATAAAQETQQQTSQQAFNQGAYDVGVQNDRNARNVTQFADVRNVNTGLGSQHQLSLGNAKAGSMAKIQYAQSEALKESQRQAALQEELLRNRVAQALADNDYKRAAALMDEKNRAQADDEANAKVAASFGQFGGMNAIYGAETAGKMQTLWNAQHPEEAYRLGRISADDYKNITGNWPAGYTPPSAFGGYDDWWGGGGIPAAGPDGKPLNQMQALANFSNGRSNAGSPIMSLAASGQEMKSTGYDRYHTQ